ncbi:MAG: hypothetical protein Q9163_003741 [Psora crenata]
MAYQFYNRYIPRSSNTQNESSEIRPAKRRKENKPYSNPQESLVQNAADAATLPSDQASVIEHSLAQVDLDSHTEPPKLKKTSKKDKRNGAEIVGPTVEDQSTLDERLALEKHHGIISKYATAIGAPALSGEGNISKENGDDASQGYRPSIEPHGLDPLPQPPETVDSPKVSTRAALPAWLQNPAVVSVSDTLPFAELPLRKGVVASLERSGFRNALPIQTAIIRMLLSAPTENYNDICVSSATGSGKTLAYALPMVEALQAEYGHRLTGLIVLPTRELVSQVKETLKLCSSGTALKIATAVGSKSLKEEEHILIEKDRRYDPEAFKSNEAKVIDEDEVLMDWDYEAMMHPLDECCSHRNYIVEYRSKIDILVCTPGRLAEHINSTKGFTLHHVRWLVIDEADRLLDESFQQWVDIVMPELEYMPPLSPLEQKLDLCSPFVRRREIRKFILSATMTRDVGKLAGLKLRRPKLVVLESQKSIDDVNELNRESDDAIEIPAGLHEAALPIPDIANKPLHLLRILESPLSAPEISMSVSRNRQDQESASDDDTSSEVSTSSESSDSHSENQDVSTKLMPRSTAVTKPGSTHGALIFTNNNENAQRLGRLLTILKPELATKVGTLAKSSGTATGQKTLKAFQKRKLSIIIASDRASRGLDLQDLAHVINYDMPKSLTSYIHRVGRTARAGKEGFATTFVAHHEARWFWNEIARAQNVVRAPGRKVRRLDAALNVSEDEMERYQKSLALLRAEAQGGNASS